MLFPRAWTLPKALGPGAREHTGVGRAGAGDAPRQLCRGTGGVDKNGSIAWLDQLIESLICPHHKTHEAQDADQGVLGDGEGAHALRVVGGDLQEGRDDERQGAAAHGAHQGEDQVQAGDEDG